MERVCVIGLGYIGLPTAAVLASRGLTVHGVELNDSAVESINAGYAHIVEPELDMLVQAGVQTERLRAHREPTEAEAFIICVPTPLQADHRPDLDCIDQACASIAPYLKPGNLVVLESTVPPGTTEQVARRLRSDTGLDGCQLHVAHAPERVLPGRILREVVENARMIGGVDPSSTEACRTLYAQFVSGKLLTTDARTAETAKLLENAYRDVNIAFANELSMLAEHLQLDVWQLLDLANHHPRVNILNPGPGVGGHCIAVDPHFLMHVAPDHTLMIAQARQVNNRKSQWVVQRAMQLAERFKHARIAVLGLSYKPNIDDLRESPALAIARQLRDQSEGELRVVEPNLSRHEDFDLWDLDAAIRDADLVLILVAHHQFNRLSPEALSEKVVLDTCGALNRQ